MRSFYQTIILFLFSSASIQQAQAQKPLSPADLPPNPQAGHCYVRCATQTKKGAKLKWEDVDCAIINFQHLPVLLNGVGGEPSREDNNVISKLLLPYFKDNYRINIESHYDSRAADSINIKRSRARGIALANHLVAIGVPPELISINARGNNSKPKTIGFTYRLINQSEDEVFASANPLNLVQKNGLWCLAAVE